MGLVHEEKSLSGLHGDEVFHGGQLAGDATVGVASPVSLADDRLGHLVEGGQRGLVIGDRQADLGIELDERQQALADLDLEVLAEPRHGGAGEPVVSVSPRPSGEEVGVGNGGGLGSGGIRHGDNQVMVGSSGW